jgi:small-conductance mechanosensitive channel
MSNQLQHSGSKRQFSREGFKPIPFDHTQTEYYNTMPPPNDATIDIPLEQVRSNASGTGLRKMSTTTPAAARDQMLQPALDDEKQTFFRGRRAKKDAEGNGKGTGRVGYDGEEDTLTTMGRIYEKIVGFSIFTRYLLYVFPLGLMIAVPIIVGATVGGDNNPPKIGGVPIVWLFTWIEIVWLSLWVSKLFAHFLPYIFQIFVGVVSSGVRKYSTVIRKLEIPLSLVGWSVTSVATFKPLMTGNPYNRVGSNEQPGDWVNILQAVLGAAVASSLVFLAEKTIINLIQINYHRKQFNARIKDSKRQVFILGLLYDASRALFPAYCPEFAEEDFMIASQLQLAAFGGKNKKASHNRTGSTTPMRLIQNIGRVGDKVTSAFGNVAQEITGRQVFNPSSSHSIVVEALEKKRTSEALARRIWMSLVEEGREALLEEDLIDVMGPNRKAEAEEAYWALDRDGNGDISLEEMITTVTEWGRERKAIASSMVDVAQAINVLDRLLCTVVLIAIIFIFIAFLNRNFVTTLATTGTALLSLSFVFSVTAQEVLGSCIFLFVKHPYDIGDRVDIGEQHFIVDHISLLFTIFKRANGLKTGQLCQYPNVVLNSLALDNVSRSKNQTEQITLDIAFETSFDDIQILKNELITFCKDGANNRDFYSDPEVELLGTSDMSKLQLKVEIKHKSNWANETLRASRRSKFMCALVAALRAVPIYPPGGGFDVAGTAANPAFGVTISEAEAKEHAQAAALEREKARLVPLKKIEEAKQDLDKTDSDRSAGAGGGLSSSDAKAISDLNARDPGANAAKAENEVWASGRDDTSTLGGGGGMGSRPSIDTQEISDVRNILRRASTRGKRKPSSDISRQQSIVTGQLPSIPAVHEDGFGVGDYGMYGEQGVTRTQSYQSPPPMNSAGPAGWRPTLGQTQSSRYQTSPSTVPTLSGQQGGVEMSQLQQRQGQQPYGQPGRRPDGSEEEVFDDKDGNVRPYAGV